MVSNAGTARIIPLIESAPGLPLILPVGFLITFPATVEDWNKIHSVNALGTMLCFKHAAIQMIKQGRGGRIIGEHAIAPIFLAFDASPLQVPAPPWANKVSTSLQDPAMPMLNILIDSSGSKFLCIRIFQVRCPRTHASLRYLPIPFCRTKMALTTRYLSPGTQTAQHYRE